MAAGLLAGAVLTGVPGCANNDTTSALADLAATTSGNVVEILVNGFLHDWLAHQQPDPSIPLAQQQH